MKIEFKDWQAKQLRNYFGRNDKTSLEHWAFKKFDDAVKNESGIHANMNLSVTNVSFVKEGTNEGEFAKFDMLAIELPPEGRKITINEISGEVVLVEHDLSNNTAKVWISNE